MAAVDIAFAVGWGVFLVYWLVAAFSAKRGRTAWAREVRIRVVLAVLAVVLVRWGVFRGRQVDPEPWRSAVGLVLFAAGLTFAVWARVHIGRNWGTPMSQKNDPELVTSGPYRWVRHPIYTGILVAGIGSAVALDWTWLAVVALAGAYFGYSAVVEERNLAAQFPDTYPAYRRSTWMLMPFVF